MASPLRFWMLLLGGVAVTIAGVRWWTAPAPELAPPAATADAEPAVPEPRPVAAGQPGSAGSAAESPDQNPPPEEDGPEYSDGGSGPSAEEVADRIRTTRPAVVLFLAAPCPACSEAMPDFVAELDENGNGIEVLAYALPASDPFEVDALLQSHNASFSAEVLRQWRPGEFSKAMEGVGIVAGSSFTVPLFAVIGRNGEVIIQWQGGFDRAWLRKALLLAAS